MRTIASLRPFPMRVGNFVGNTIEKAAVLPISIPPRKKYLVYSLFTWGGRCPSAHTGADEGAIDWPNGAGEEKRRGDRSLLLQGKVGTGSPPHQSPSVTASPPRGSLWVVQPYTKKRPKSGHVHGPRNSPTTAPLRPTTPKRASENERAIKEGGPGGNAPGALSSGFLRRKPGSRPESGGKPTSQGPPCAGPNQNHLPIRQPPHPTGIGKENPP